MTTLLEDLEDADKNVDIQLKHLEKKRARKSKDTDDEWKSKPVIHAFNKKKFDNPDLKDNIEALREMVEQEEADKNSENRSKSDMSSSKDPTPES